MKRARVPPFEREPEPLLGSHRTTARGIVLLVILGLAGGATAAPPPDPGKRPEKKQPATAEKPQTSRMVFPVVGKVQYTNDFGDARAQGGHQGNDIMAPRRALAVATEDGTVKFHTTSWAAGCMLYLYGKSGKTYLYIHLNNDLSSGNDNRGKCVAGTAYAPGLKDGAKVQAGQHIAYVGDSGDANGVAPHLHFELHPRGRGATNPFSALNSAARLLFASPPGKPFTLALTGTVSTTTGGLLQMRVTQLRSWPGGLKVTNVGRSLGVRVPDTAVVDGISAARGLGSVLSLLRKGLAVTVWTTRAPASLDAQLGRNGALSVDRVVVQTK